VSSDQRDLWIRKCLFQIKRDIAPLDGVGDSAVASPWRSKACFCLSRGYSGHLMLVRTLMRMYGSHEYCYERKFTLTGPFMTMN
jgi:hypothetical protein